MTINVVFIPADLTLPVEVRELSPHLGSMQQLIGGHLEVLSLYEPEATLYLDEEGKLKRRPLNQRATELVQRHSPLREFIVGDCFISGPPDADGDETSVPAFYVELCDG